MIDSLKDYLSRFPGQGPQAIATSPGERESRFDPLANYRMNLELDRIRALAATENNASRTFLEGIVSKLQRVPRLTSCEAKFLATALQEILDGTDARQALLLKKTNGAGRSAKDRPQIATEVALRRFLGLVLEASISQAETVTDISRDTIKRAVREVRDGAYANFASGWQESELRARLTSEVVSEAAATDSVTDACKSVAKRYSETPRYGVNWTNVSYSVGAVNILRSLGAEAVWRSFEGVDAVLEQRGLSTREISEVDPRDLEPVQIEIGRGYLLQSIEPERKTLAAHVIDSVLSARAVVTDRSILPSLVRNRHKATADLLRRPRRDTVSQLRKQLKMLLPGFSPPQGLRYRSFLDLSPSDALVAFLLLVSVEDGTEEQWSVAKDLADSLYEQYKIEFRRRYGPVSADMANSIDWRPTGAIASSPEERFDAIAADLSAEIEATRRSVLGPDLKS